MCTTIYCEPFIGVYILILEHYTPRNKLRQADWPAYLLTYEAVSAADEVILM